MNASVMQQLDIFARRLAPLGITFVLVVLETLRMPLPGVLAISPALSLIATYYWAVRRPDLMPPVAVFAVGVLLDIVTGAVLGVNALVLLLVYAAVVGQRRRMAERSFNVIWSGFVFACVLAGLLIWTLQSLIHGALLGPGPVIVQLLVTTVLYPAVVWLLRHVDRVVLRDL